MKEDNQILLDSLLNDSSFKNWATKNNKNDIVFWNAWIENNPDKIDIAFDARAIILGISFEKNTIHEDRVNEKLDLVLDRIKKSDGATVIDLPKKQFESNIKRFAAVAATVLVFMVLTFNMLDSSQDIVHKTAFGETIDLKLPDGTSVVLNGNSELRYNKENPRDVSLKGEAYFKVKPKYSTQAKFWVNTEDLRVEVYGTQFNVNTRNKKTDVVLDEGSIHLLLKNGSSEKMLPGEYVSYSSENQIVTHDKVSDELPYALRRGETYTFNKMKLGEVMKYIEHTYGIPSEFDDKALENKIISGGIPNENLEICLMAIQKATGVKIITKEHTLLIYKQ